MGGAIQIGIIYSPYGGFRISFPGRAAEAQAEKMILRACLSILEVRKLDWRMPISRLFSRSDAETQGKSTLLTG